MDSNQEAANLAQIKSYRLNLWLVILAILQIVSPFVIWLIQRNQAGGFMVTGWIPIILLLLSSAVTATALLIVATKRLRTKRLVAAINRLEAELSQAKSDLEHELGKPKFVLDTGKIDSLNEQLDAAKEAANQIQARNNVLEDKLHTSQGEVERLNIALSLANIREGELKRELSSAKQLKETAERTLEIRQHEVFEVTKKLDVQLEQYAQYDRGLREQTEQIDSLRVMLQDARQDAETANQRANQEENQRNEYIRLEAEARRELAALAPLLAIAEEQAQSIKDHVIIAEARPARLVIGRDGSVCIFVELVIRNESLFFITLCAEDVKGSFRFAERVLKEPVSMIIDMYRDPIENLPPFQPAKMLLEQPLRGFEIELMERALNAGADARIYLANLVIPISVGDGSQVKTQNLRISPEKEYVPLKDSRNTNNA